jgi:hypothetical protein
MAVERVFLKVGNVFGIRAVARRRDGSQTKPLFLLQAAATVCSTVQQPPVGFERFVSIKVVIVAISQLLSTAFPMFCNVIILDQKYFATLK